MPICTLVKETIDIKGVAYAKPECKVVKNFKILFEKRRQKEVEETKEGEVWQQEERQERKRYSWHTKKSKENRDSRCVAKDGRCGS